MSPGLRDAALAAVAAIDVAIPECNAFARPILEAARDNLMDYLADREHGGNPVASSSQQQPPTE